MILIKLSRHNHIVHSNILNIHVCLKSIKFVICPMWLSVAPGIIVGVEEVNHGFFVNTYLVKFLNNTLFGVKFSINIQLQISSTHHHKQDVVDEFHQVSVDEEPEVHLLDPHNQSGKQ